MSELNVPRLKMSSGYEIPQLGLGTWLLRDAACERVVSEALEVGYRHIDTAAVYENEREVGRAIELSGVDRASLFITTKLANSEQHDPAAAFERSLERLGLDYVDLYLLHWPLPARNTSLPAWRALTEIAESGRARTIGVCNYEIVHLEELIAETGVVPAINQIELHPEHQRSELVEYCRERGIVIESWGPFAQGKSDLLSRSEVLRIAKAHGKTPAQVVLRWHIEREHVVIPKTSSRERLIENADVFDVSLSQEDRAALDAFETGTNYGPDPYTYDG